MARAARSSGGLAQRIVRTAFIVGVCTITAALAFSLVSVSRLTAEMERGRDLRVIEYVDDQIASQLRASQRAVSQASEQAVAQSGPSLEDALGAAFRHGPPMLSRVIVADPLGEVIASYPHDSTPTATVRKLPAFVNALAGRTGFDEVRREGGDWELWMTRTAIGRTGEPLVILVQLDTAFVDDAVRGSRDAADGGMVLLLDGTGVLANNDPGETLDIQRAEWSPASGSGTVKMMAEDGEPYSGRYRDLRGLEGLSWRAVAVQPAIASWNSAMRSIAPAVLVLALGGGIALVSVWGLSQRMVRPLRDLERAARNAASGSYVRPLSTESDDELSRVADAFNAVSIRLNALQDLSQLLASTSRLDEVLDAVLASVSHLVGPEGAAIYLLEDGHFVPVRTRGAEFANVGPIDSQESAWLNAALATRQPVELTGGNAELERELPGIAAWQAHALAAPLLAGDEELGAIVVLRHETSPLSEGEQEMLRTFSAHAAVAVQTSRLFEIESESRRIAEALRSVAEELVRPESLRVALATVEDIVADLFDAAVATVAVVDPVVLGMDSSRDRQDARLLALAYRAFGQRTRAAAVTIERTTDPAAAEVLDDYRATRLLVVPIALETDHGAVLIVGLRDGVPIRGVTQIGEAIADEIALALDNAYFYQRALTRATNLETIFRISQAVGSSLQLNVVLNRVLDVVQKILSADAVALMLHEVGGRTLATSMGRGDLPGRILNLRLEIGEDIPGQVSKRGEPVALRDLHEGMGGVAGMAAGSGLRSLLAVPLLARGRGIGVLMVFSKAPGSFTAEEVNVLQTFASQAALAIDTARLYSREHEVSSVLQQSILPEELPDYDELEAGSVYAPASVDVEIGGDYYDLFRGPHGTIWFAIADVCGKGVYAATKTSMIKYVIRALVKAGHSPARVVGEVNDMIAERDDPSGIVTLWLGQFDPATRVVRWADAGHPPALLRRAGGTIERLTVTGPLLGARYNVEYDEHSTKLEPGDAVLLYTDGVTEARSGNIFFGEDRVMEVLSRDASPPTLAQVLLDTVRQYTGGKLRDDVAVLVLKARDDVEPQGRNHS